MSEPRALLEHLIRHEFGRLCAVLTRSLGVRWLDLAEDVVGAALVQALETWSRRGERAGARLRALFRQPLNLGPLLVGDRHDRESGDPDQGKIHEFSI